ncbi:DAK2 domain-containing protein [Arthrobacter sp. zg-Y916]|uniref:DAK2 domain-containing protein n=1 Tax=Arthrobacter caoxuetaonis TaxID=2886935 RepID=A0A9X1MDJ9_9MICC|nr:MULTISPECIES: DAK2 domain-containing protein [Arthrobacter]MCC3282478.1 DAK2 domain-containing protein [Arthrobacter caoxuetaonis]MCC3297616.1 DAK2 domain-containing protein [Arthrobacter caoxuetaonis]MCC9193841.1 DAK2 domain-containing protein [Arthrobacter sp. zg-Y916]USQ58886.1 DAK2 domain-containing protein [Arthrobacter caoxuetaonis]
MKRWLSKAEISLGNHSDRLNAINIFPVADGDTGTNLYLTMRAASAAAAELETQDIGELLSVAGRSAMEQARGNSGTLLSVFLTAMAEPLAGDTRLSAPLLARALERAQLRSWSVLSDPVPGTMLSVLEEAARAASRVEAAQSGDDSNAGLAETLRAVMTAALAAVIRTEEQLKTLTDARVVDAGGVGFLLVLDALRAAALGEELQGELLDGLHGYDVQDPHIHSTQPQLEGVEVMCTIILSPLDAATMRLQLDELGESVIMSAVSPVGDGYRWRVHVHTPDAGAALELLRTVGEPTNVTITELSADGHQTSEIPQVPVPGATAGGGLAREA